MYHFAFCRAYKGNLPGGVSKVAPFCAVCLDVEGAKFELDRDIPNRIAQDPNFSEWPLVVLTDDLKKATKDVSAFLWTSFTRFEPAADLYAFKTEVQRHHLCYTPPIVIDARLKPWYPPEVECDLETSKLVDARWGGYFGSSRI